MLTHLQIQHRLCGGNDVGEGSLVEFTVVNVGYSNVLI